MNVTQEELAGDMVRTITQLIRGKQGEELFHLVVTGNLGLRLSNMIKDGLMGFAQRVQKSWKCGEKSIDFFYQFLVFSNFFHQ